MKEFLVGLALIAVVASECKIPIKHYKTMACTAVTDSKSDCPTRYECPSITKHDNSKCYFNGRTYELSESIPNALVNPFCSAQCYCRSASPFAQFRCSNIDCADTYQKIGDDCIRTYKPNSCCSTGKVCGEERKKLATCVVKGAKYLAGERMHPTSNKCFTCICHAGFSEANIAVDPNCYESSCGFELSSSSKQAYSGAAPVYFEDGCCPWEWRMPKESDKLVEQSGKKVSSHPALQCKYGKLTMNIGDMLIPEVTNGFTYTCTCAIPPMVQCARSKNTAV
ncbi:uncharacterized protein LOC128737836 [Sabethes cyaneus]|uniref:uncharacterized protein LOC128737836 n=1 Tax=Sabethes cyaneus TaxID=53552 RepID=UPI00237E2041|nr:uncharacterized protein LOC128737836 [Sabethes cyaneus]